MLYSTEIIFPLYCRKTVYGDTKVVLEKWLKKMFIKSLLVQLEMATNSVAKEIEIIAGFIA